MASDMTPEEYAAKSQVMYDRLKMAEHYLIVEDGHDLWTREQELMVSLRQCAAQIAIYNIEGPVAVVRLAFDEPPEVVSHRKLVAEVYDYVTTSLIDGPDDEWTCPFLDMAYPDWRHTYRVEQEHERQYRDDAQFYARTGT